MSPLKKDIDQEASEAEAAKAGNAEVKAAEVEAAEAEAADAKSHHKIRDAIAASGERAFNEEKNKYMRPVENTGKTVQVGSKPISVADIIKLGGLVAFFGLMVLIVVLIWPYIHEIFEPNGLQKLIAQVQDAGVVGFAILFGLQLLQVIVAFIPGEVTAIAAGMLYGPWLGGVLILVGGAVASAIVYWIVHFLGAPFVHDIVPASLLETFREYERSGKFNVILFLLFLIPGLPKDLFTYIVGLTDMKCSTFVILSTIARTPGVLVTTFAASDFASGDYVQAIVIFVVFAIIAIVGILSRDVIMGFLSGNKGGEEAEAAAEAKVEAKVAANVEAKAEAAE